MPIPVKIIIHNDAKIKLLDEETIMQVVNTIPSHKLPAAIKTFFDDREKSP